MRHSHPEITIDEVASTLYDRYRLDVQDIIFLPVGDGGWCYRAVSRDGISHFVKIARHAKPQTVEAIVYITESYNFPAVPILRSASNAPYATLRGHTLIVHPFIEGDIVRNLRDAAEAHYIGVQFGRLHGTDLPDSLASALAKDVFSPRGGTLFKRHLLSSRGVSDNDDVSRELSEFILDKKNSLRNAYEAAVELGWQAKVRRPPLVLCQGDANPWNMMRTADSGILLIDWDDLWFSSKEGDMIRFLENNFSEFMEGYRSILLEAKVDELLVAYYKQERIVRNASDCVTRIVTPAAVAIEQRKEELEKLKGIFEPGGMLEDAEIYRQRIAKQ
jgi:hypothetical protein